MLPEHARIRMQTRLVPWYRLYPTIVTTGVVDDLHRQAQAGSVVDWAAFRQSETSAAAHARHAESGAQGSNWGFSGGSGGGGGTVGGGVSW